MRVTAIIGSYRQGGCGDQITDVILKKVESSGAEVRKIYLSDVELKYCTNCRACTQQPGPERGKCQISDDMDWVLREIEASDAVVLVSAVNFGTVTALMKCFSERLVCYAYWPWNAKRPPKLRNKRKSKFAVLVTTSAAPACLGRLVFKPFRILKAAALVLGAKTVDKLFIGLCGQSPDQKISERTKARANKAAMKLVSKIKT